MFNTTKGSPLKELNFLTSILAVRMNKKRLVTKLSKGCFDLSFESESMVLCLILVRLVVVLVEKTFVYDLNTLAMLDTIDTVPNPKGSSASFLHQLL